MKHNEGFVEIVNDTKTRIQQIDIPTVYRFIQENHSFKLIDVREHNEWNTGHLPTALHISKGVIERDIENVIPNLYEKIILYCGGGSRSALAAENLQRMGYHHVFSMEGGFRGWQALNYPVEK